jgi:hypothetical protein
MRDSRSGAIQISANGKLGMTRILKSLARAGVVTGLALFSAVGSAAETVEPAASLIRYEVPGGETFFALSLKTGALPAAPRRDHVILFDTSASQAGAHRRQALAVLDGFLAALDKSDRVRLFSCDVKVKPLSDDFQLAPSAETKEAVAKLQRVVPLGATALQPALEAALNALTDDHGRSIVYIGDGMSTAQLIQLPELRDLLSRARQMHAPIHSFAVGPRTDLQLLGTLAEHTGGVVFVDALVDDAKVSPAQIGKKLALAANAAAFYPDKISLTPEADGLLPTPVPPLRADRDTIVLGKGRVSGTLKVTISGEGRSIEWNVKPAAPQPGNTFLVRLWGAAEQTGGLAVAVAGQELLGAARQEFEEQVQQLVAMGRRAVAARDLKLAEEIAQSIRQLDPQNVEAETILNAVQKAKSARDALDRQQKKAPATKPR